MTDGTGAKGRGRLGEQSDGLGSAGPMVEVEALSKSFGARTALSRVSLRVEQGEHVTLVGPNGAGKTTLLRVLALLSRPTAGTVRIAGLDAARHGIAIRRQIGFLSHRTLLYEDLTAQQNLAFSARMYDLADAAPRIEQLLGEVGLEARRHDLVRTYSRGMQQRLSIARALLHRPRLLLLDEPYAGLDLQGAQALEAQLARLAGEGCTVVMASHDLGRATVATGRVIVLARGRVRQDLCAGEFDGAQLAAVYERLVDGTNAELQPLSAGVSRHGVR